MKRADCNFLTVFVMRAMVGVVTGCQADTLVNELLAGYFEEQAKVRQTLRTRYDEIKSGRGATLDGPTVF